MLFSIYSIDLYWFHHDWFCSVDRLWLQNVAVLRLCQSPWSLGLEASSLRNCWALTCVGNSMATRFCVCVVLGMLLGIAVRTGSPLNLSLAEPVWKQLAGMKLSLTDLNEIDKDYVPGQTHRWTNTSRQTDQLATTMENTEKHFLKQFTLYLLLNSSNYVPLFLSYFLLYVSSLSMYQYLLTKTCYLVPYNHVLCVPYPFTFLN